MGSAYATTVSTLSQETAQYAVDTYQSAMVDSLAQLVRHDTRAIDGVLATENPAHIAFKNDLKSKH